MPVDTISTYAAFQSTLGDISKVETELTTAQRQLSSGDKFADFKEMGGQTQQFLSVEATIRRTSQYLNDNQVIETRIATTSTTLDQVIATATNLQNLISQRRTGVSANESFPAQLQGLWQQLVGQLNTQAQGQYIFAGTKIDTPPVDAGHFPTLVEEGTPDDGYYHGSRQDVTARIQDNITLTYNVRADAPAFQKIFAGLAMASKGHRDGNDAALAQAYDLVQDGLKGVISAQATVNANKVQLSTIDQGHQTVKLYWQGIKETIGNTDIISVSTQVAINQGILQAAFQAFAKITSLRLSDYLK